MVSKTRAACRQHAHMFLEMDIMIAFNKRGSGRESEIKYLDEKGGITLPN